MVINLKTISKSILLIAFVVGFGCILYFHLYQYLSYSALKKYHLTLLGLAHLHYFLTVVIYMLVYIVAVTLSVPGAVFITLAGGLLFGPIAALYVVISVTIGSVLLFLIVRTALCEWLSTKTSGWIAKMEKGFQNNAFNYLLFLRLMPVFPCWVTNIVAALLDVRLRTFMLATLIGIIPGTVVYVIVGNGLSTLFANNQATDFKNIFTPAIVFPLFGLAMLSLLPVTYQRWKGDNHD